RLDRGLERRVTLARGGLDRAGAALRPAILERQVERGRDRLAATWRLVQSLNPDRILERGYARITARPGGETLSSAEAARAVDTLTLRFRDGTVDVAVDRVGDQAGLERPAPKTYDKPRREPKADPSQPSQPTLL
ncbi:exodeoxyribonuclease VII large subunit, partial [Sphingomonas sp.]|uniref:exodeoxyribonuclease VII large subunit n=1 Tax=Sphingomonas sp. TaxID=28214 RepID=UPI002899B7E6